MFHKDLCSGRFFSFYIQRISAQLLQPMACCITVMPVTQIYFFCYPLNLASLKDRVLSCIDAIAEWMQVNRLHINSSKTEFLWCATLRRSHCISAKSFKLADGEVKPVSRVCNLGALFDSDMNMRSHVNRLVSSCYCNVFRRHRRRRNATTTGGLRHYGIQWACIEKGPTRTPT